MNQELLRARLASPLTGVEAPTLPEPYRGKVRDSYILGEKRIIVTTDRVSAFDTVLGVIPYKGQVLSQLANWWFSKTHDIVSNHLLSELHPNAVLVAEAQPIPIEVVVRAYLTGSSKTALWTLYEQGKEDVYGLKLPAGLSKNTKLEQPVVTPTTKDESDTPLNESQILERGLLSQEMWTKVKETALRLFERGQELAAQAGLVLVDTKYEFGLLDGELILIDEIHTPDSSRYWVAGSEHDALPLHQDKEVLRLWLVEQGFRGDGVAPEIPEELALKLAGHYVDTYERLTGHELRPPTEELTEVLCGVEI